MTNFFKRLWHSNATKSEARDLNAKLSNPENNSPSSTERKAGHVADAEAKRIILSKERVLGRLYGFCWVLIEKRDPNFNGEKLKGENMMSVVLQSMAFAKEDEVKVMNEALTIIQQLTDEKKSTDSSQEQRDGMIGALEGKMIEYLHLDPHRLIEGKEIRS